MITPYVITSLVFGMVLFYLWVIHHFWLRHVFKDDHKPAVRTRIVILGGGFGGLYLALHFDKTIASDPTVEVTLVSRQNFLVFTPMLHEVAAGDPDLSEREPSAEGGGQHCDRPTTSRIRWRRGATLPAVIARLLNAP